MVSGNEKWDHLSEVMSQAHKVGMVRWDVGSGRFCLRGVGGKLRSLEKIDCV
jgi:hypothetical protein